MAPGAGKGEHRGKLGEAVLLGQRWGPEAGRRQRRVLRKAAVGGGEEREIRRLWWSGAEGT